MKTSFLLQDLALLTSTQEKLSLIETFLRTIKKLEGVRNADLYDLHTESPSFPPEESHNGKDPPSFSLSHSLTPGTLFTIESSSPFQTALRTHRIVTWRKEGSHTVHMILPVRMEGEIRQFLTIETGEEKLPHRGRILYLMRIYRNILRLQEKNDHDSLTGLLNRHAFQRHMRKIIQHLSSLRERREKDGLRHYLVMLDLDHFKRINDDFGHLMGDEVLIRFAHLLEESFRYSDQKFRYGGEEFALVIQNEKEGDIATILERFRMKVASHTFAPGIHLTVSGGFLEVEPGETTVELVEKADRALYYAKENGRNRISDYTRLVEENLIQPAAYATSEVILWRQRNEPPKREQERTKEQS